MNSKYLDGIHTANKEAKLRKNVKSKLNSLKDSIKVMEQETGEDMTTECVMELLEKE